MAAVNGILKERTQLRRLFTRAFNVFQNKIAEEGVTQDDVFTNFKLLEDKADRLFVLDEKLHEASLDNEGTDEDAATEYDEVESYRDKWTTAKCKYEKFTEFEIPCDLSSTRSSVSQTSRLISKLPKLSLVKFSGDIKQWLPFWAQFKRIDESSELDDAEKVLYLRESMTPGTRAYELVNGFPPVAENYSKAVELLKARYGRKDLLIELYVRDIINLVTEKPTLSVLYDRIEVNVRSLESMGLTTDNYAALLFPLVESCLTDELIRVWQRRGDNMHETGSQEKLKNLLEFLKSEVENEEYLQLTRKISNISASKTQISKPLRKPDVPTAQGLVSTGGVSSACAFCKLETHASSECQQVKGMPLEERKSRLFQNGACFKCLKVGHVSRKCHTRLSCNLCKRQHYPIMCDLAVRKAEKEPQVSPQSRSVTNFCINASCVYLQTVLVKVVHGYKQELVRVLLDSASQHSYVKEELAERLGLQKIRKMTLSHAVFGGSTGSPVEHRVFELVLQNIDNSNQLRLTALSQPVICSQVPRLTAEQVLKLGLSHLDVGRDKDIEILIGADFLGSVLLNERRTVGDLTAMLTTLGWTVFGRDQRTERYERETTPILLNIEKVSKLWELDVLGIEDPITEKRKCQLEEEARLDFLETVQIKEDGRYEVRLPWLKDHLPLDPLYEIAEKRLEITKRKLESNEHLEEYGKVFQDWLNEGIIEEVTGDETEISGHYLPHRPVIKNSATTPVRPVFDASARRGNNPSLNDCLEKGPNLIKQIPSLILQFRKKSVGIIADIRKAFLQISVASEDRDFLRFLWGEKDVKTYRHRRVVFGVTSSPFLLGAVIEHLLDQALLDAQDGNNVTVDIIRQLKGSFYVDNCVTSVSNKEELELFVKTAQDIFAQHKFELRGWESTDPLLQDDSKMSPVLGIMWNRKEDTLCLNCEPLEKISLEKITKRTVLSTVHRIYDPVGFAVPIMLLPKLLLQKINEISWDMEVSLEIKATFRKWLCGLRELYQMEIPRRFPEVYVERSIHVFCDASQDAYAAVVFLRTQTEFGVQVQLLQAKSRIAPLPRPTIPRLELMGATISARLLSAVKREFDTESVYLWTDSTTVLTWIQREVLWSVFVENRVREIRQLTPKEFWRHVPGALNPADLPTRGCGTKELITSRWWEGPSWLYLPAEEWPSDCSIKNEDEIMNERRKTASSLVTTEEPLRSDWYYKYFSRFDKIVRLIGWIKRFIFNCKSKGRKTGELSCSELEDCERTVIKLIQKEWFRGPEDQKLTSVVPMVDEHSILRVNTRVLERVDTFEFRQPAVLPGDHPVVQRLIHDTHVKNCHVGPQTLLGVLRERFWILNGRRVARSCVRKCVICRRYKKERPKVSTPPLPNDRVRDAKIFEVVGVDLAGPLIVRGNQKMWVCLFTCAVYRAVHLELLASLSTDSFLQGLRRFISRRGRPSTIYSDNGTNFRGASNMMAKLDWQKIESYHSVQRISWKFNPPTASWWGGWWERLIGLLKDLLRKVLGKSSLTSEELMTLLCECEAIINNRPLTSDTENPDDLRPISPAMFLQEGCEVGVPDLEALDGTQLRKRAAYRQQLKNALRQRFRKEYLGQLQLKQNQHDKFSEGDVVLIEMDNLNKLEWPLGIIEDLLPGKDGRVRVVRLRTKRGVIMRPVQRLIPLECSLSSAEEADQKIDASKRDPNLEIDRTRCGRVVKRPARFL